MLYNLKMEDFTQRLLNAGEFPTDTDIAKGLCQSDWKGSGVTVTEPYITFSLYGGGVTSVPYASSNPALFAKLKSSDWNTVVLTIINGSSNGYRLTFPTTDNQTPIILSRLDAGSETVLASYDTGFLWGSSTYFNIDWIIYSGGIVVALEGDIVLQSDDTTHRLTDWKYKFTCSDGSHFLHTQKLHHLTAHTEKWQYNINLLDTKLWSSGTYNAGHITLASGYDCVYKGLIFPKEDYVIQLTFNNTGQGTHSSRWGLVSPDYSTGIYLLFTAGVGYYLKSAGGTTLASYSSSGATTATSKIQMNIANCGHIYGVIGSITLDTANLNYHYRSAVLHLQDISANQDITLHKIEVSNNDTIYGFTDFTREEVKNKVRRIVNPI